MQTLMIRLLFFARLREELGVASEELALPDNVRNVAALMANLAARGGVWQSRFDGGVQIRAAVNQELAANDAVIKPGDEIAFFPSVTGG
jgi:molybdopterin synthase sulfur carrier subunit